MKFNDFEIALFIQSYIATMFWADAGEEDQIPSDGEINELAQELVERDCRAFLEKAEQQLLLALPSFDGNANMLARAAHDFYLTRQGHGAGFWDSSELWVNGTDDTLTAISHEFPDIYFYEGDDGSIYRGGS